MADSNTPNLNLTKPEVGVATDWATKWNANADKIDAAVQYVSQSAANAEADAQTGITKANAAKAAADAAQQTANTAETDAQTGITKANTAQTTANTAEADAQTGITKANAAKAAADAAQQTANTAETDAQTGITKANAAQAAANAAQARADAAYARMPAGVIADWAGSGSPPAGWLVCNGASISRASYPDLFNAIGGTYGAADNNSFSVPDIRGLFRRAIDDGRGVDGGRGFNSVQGSQNLSHSHSPSNGSGYFISGGTGANIASGEYLGVSSITASGGNESRPINIAFRAIIKY